MCVLLFLFVFAFVRSDRVKDLDNDEYAYNFFMKCVESGIIMNDEPIEVLFKSIDDVDYTPVEYVLPDEQLTEILSDVTQDKTILKVTYSYQGKLYKVTESSITHSKLQADENFFAEFFQKATGKNIIQDNLDESYSSQINPHHTMPGQEILIESPDDDENDSKFGWDNKSILFLLSKYSERLAKFRSPTIKKITLWKEIEKEFHKIGISQVNAQMIDHKFRNLKARYKNIKNNNKKTGRGRQAREWYQQMAEILESDKSVNFDIGISSMDDGAINLSQHRISSAYSDAETSADTSSNSHHLDAGDCSCSSNAVSNGEPISSGSAQYLTCSNPSKESKTRKSTHAKNLYSQRNRALQQESSKIDVLRSIENKYDRVLQQEASKIDVLRSIEIAVAHKNELLQRKNELLERRNELLESLIEKKNNTTQ
ncbi:uncharacterized protein LOC105838393 isoform X3 [Monomorium pharaonis]|uniref:uncharacterized protein LOC105838393 isoform X3 n=1 Tax=Monomorium pharaonis TaxID=307658 RepID=UPI0017461DB3|nr:uncharacterized protein LOC105838393 isoform X3 [Monomorium pharaonis]